MKVHIILIFIDRVRVVPAQPVKLWNRHGGHGGRRAGNAIGIDALHDVVVGLPILDGRIDIRGLRRY
jgi:hypothetical protein